MFALDEPEHKHIRMMQSGDFRIAKIETWRPRIQQIVDATLDELLKMPRPVDLFEAFTHKVPTIVISEMLGVPESDSSYFQERAHAATDSATSVVEAEKALSELSKFLEDLVVKKDADPTDDILSRMAVEQVRTGQLTNAEVADLCVMLLIAGHHTTANMLALSTVLLLEHPDQLAEFKHGDAELVANAVEECLRFINVPHLGRRRVALEDVEVGGQLIKAGEGIIAGTMIADRDPRAFPNPDVFDIHREARHMLTFSYGVHQCLGQPLARLELQVGLSTLFKRIPSLRLAVPFEELPFDYDSTVWGLKSLPVTW
jgi:cytochrome P450